MATETIRTGSGDRPARAGRARVVVGASLLAAGFVLLAATGGYYLYGRLARSTLDDLDFAVERPQFAGQGYVLPAPPSAAVAPSEPPSTSEGVGAQPAGASQGAASTAGGTAGVSVEANASAATPAASGESGAGQSPEAARAAPSGSSRMGAGVGGDSFGDTDTPDGTSQASGAPSAAATAVPTASVSRAVAASTPSTAADAPAPPQNWIYAREPTPTGGFAKPAEPAPDTRLAAIEASIAEVSTYFAPTPQDLAAAGGLATRIRIPAIEVDAVIDELRIRQLGDSLAWETPKRVVGHIPATAKAGAAGQGWYFGHLESPLRGEGNVFARLPEIPELAAGAPVFVFLETAGRHYAYQVYVTEVVHEDEIALTDSGAHDITLVTCTPRFYYDHRLLVTAALVGIREA